MEYLLRSAVGVLLALLLCISAVWADVACDGLNDDLLSGLAFSNFIAAGTGTVMLRYKPTGLSENNFSTECFAGGALWAGYQTGVGTWLGLTRHDNYGGQDRITGYHYDGVVNCTDTAYAADAWTHLAWVHGSGTLSLYKDGLLVSSTSAGNTPAGGLAAIFHLCGGTMFTDLEIAVAEGVVEDIQIFPTALSSDTIRAIAQGGVYRLGNAARSGAWILDSCTGSANGVSFFDQSGNGRPLTGDDGPDNTGLTCQGNTTLTYPWGVD